MIVLHQGNCDAWFFYFDCIIQRNRFPTIQFTQVIANQSIVAILFWGKSNLMFGVANTIGQNALTRNCNITGHEVCYKANPHETANFRAWKNTKLILNPIFPLLLRIFLCFRVQLIITNAPSNDWSTVRPFAQPIRPRSIIKANILMHL